MSKAEDFAIKKYPVSIEDAYGHKVDVNLWQRKACVDGYHQAEKDLELGWKDMAEIVKIANLLEIEWLNGTPWDGIRDWGFYQEVLTRFKDFKERKEK